MNNLYSDAQIVSEVTLYVLQAEVHGRSNRVPGTPLVTVTTFGQGRATFTVWNDDGVTSFAERSFNGDPLTVVEAVRGLRRSAQDNPERFVCLNRTHFPPCAGLPSDLVVVA